LNLISHFLDHSVILLRSSCSCLVSLSDSMVR
jgi:hypothetical protein